MANSVKIKVKQTGRVKAPNLQDPALARMGSSMRVAQFVRWFKGVDANGQPAKKLSIKYAIIKQKYLHKRPIRDNWMTGAMAKNFAVRKAAAGTIRVENSTRLGRAHANGSQKYAEMIGFAVTDINNVIGEAQKEYGEYVKTAWIPVGSTQGSPLK
jgi:hypothetical protein